MSCPFGLKRDSPEKSYCYSLGKYCLYDIDTFAQCPIFQLETDIEKLNNELCVLNSRKKQIKKELENKRIKSEEALKQKIEKLTKN